MLSKEVLKGFYFPQTKNLFSKKAAYFIGNWPPSVKLFMRGLSDPRQATNQFRMFKKII